MEKNADEQRLTKISWQTAVLPYDTVPITYRVGTARFKPITLNDLPALHFQVSILSSATLLAILFYDRHRHSFMSLVH